MMHINKDKNGKTSAGLVMIKLGIIGEYLQIFFFHKELFVWA